MTRRHSQRPHEAPRRRDAAPALPLDGRGLAELVLRLVRAIGAAPGEAAPTMSRLLRHTGGLAMQDGYWARRWTRAALRHWLAAGRDGLQVAERAVLRAARLDAELRAMPYEVPFLFLEQRAALPAGRAAAWLAETLDPHLTAGVSAELWSMVEASERAAFFAASLAEPPLTVRLSPVAVERDRALASLASEGFRATPNPWAHTAFDLVGQRHLFETEAFLSGWIEIQDASSQRLALSVAAMAPKKTRLLDLCAGRGGKSLAIAAARPDLQVVATDLSAGRLSELPGRAARTGLPNLTIQPEIAAQGLGRTAPFDLVLVDAPCTGFGTLRRHPELRLREAASALREAVAAQVEVLRSGWEKTAPGGLLVYATCSVLRAENEAQVAAFLAAHPGASVEVIPSLEPMPAVTGGGALRFWPQHHGTDGFYFAAIRRG